MFSTRLARLRRIVVVAVSALMVGSGVVWAAPSSFAVHDTGMFELDGNIVHDSAATPPYDWASLFDASGNQTVIPDRTSVPCSHRSSRRTSSPRMSPVSRVA